LIKYVALKHTIVQPLGDIFQQELEVPFTVVPAATNGKAPHAKDDGDDGSGSEGNEGDDADDTGSVSVRDDDHEVGLCMVPQTLKFISL
jgi:hypothetical protein